MARPPTPERVATARTIRPPAVCIEGVSFSFPGAAVFSGLEMTAPAGAWTTVLGPSGCGKSTLLRLICGSLRHGMTGRIRFDDGTDPTGLCAWMAQQDLLLPWLSVVDNVLLGRRLRGRIDEAVRKRAEQFLAAAGLSDWSHSLPAVLSGGMRQRVALLRTLMESRPVILMDEPFGALDALTRLRLQDFAARWVEGATVILVTHDPLEACRLGHRIVVLHGSPAAVRAVFEPPGTPPRAPERTDMAGLYGDILRCLGTGQPPQS